MEINKAQSCSYHLAPSSLLVDVCQAKKLAICMTYCLQGREISFFQENSNVGCSACVLSPWMASLSSHGRVSWPHPVYLCELFTRGIPNGLRLWKVFDLILQRVRKHLSSPICSSVLPYKLTCFSNASSEMVRVNLSHRDFRPNIPNCFAHNILFVFTILL